LQGVKNRFEFSKGFGSCVEPVIQNDWTAFGAEKFSFEVLEEITKGENQTAEEFKSDLFLLKKIWAEKLAGEKKDLY
jgi:hypothetical protein